MAGSRLLCVCPETFECLRNFMRKVGLANRKTESERQPMKGQVFILALSYKYDIVPGPRNLQKPPQTYRLLATACTQHCHQILGSRPHQEAAAVSSDPKEDQYDWQKGGSGNRPGPTPVWEPSSKARSRSLPTNRATGRRLQRHREAHRRRRQEPGGPEP